MVRVIRGTSGDDTLNGTAGSDSIIGGAGADIMAGGAGHDRYSVDNAGDQVIEAVGKGNDVVFTSVSYTLTAGQEIESLHPTSWRVTDNLVLGGNEFDNWIFGGQGDDTLSGGGGDDRLYGEGGTDTLNGDEGNDVLWNGDIMAGGTGNDRYVVFDTAVVNEAVGGGQDTVYAVNSCTLTAGQEIEALRAVFFADYDMTLIGNEFGNFIDGAATQFGGGGDDRLWGGTKMTGGVGNNSFHVLRPDAVVNEDVGEGADTIYTFSSYTLAAEQEIETLRVYDGVAGLTLTGNGFDNHLIGGAGQNTLSGAGGDDQLDGGTGADIMAGGAGNDLYHVDNTGDVVNEAVSGGSDTVYSSANYTLAADREIEILRAGSAAGRTLAGNGFDNYIIGGAGSDTLSGAGGDDRLKGGAGGDTMAGGAGNDSYYVDSAGDVVNEAAGGGTDTVFTSVSYGLAAGQEIESLRVFGVTTGLQLRGNERDNILIGGAGDDRLESGAGNDRLFGNGGNDTLITTGASAIVHGGDGDDSIRLDSDTYTSTGEVVGGAGNDTVHSTDLGQFAIRGVETLDTYYGFLTGTVKQIASFDNYTAVLGDLDTRIALSLRGAGGALDFTTGIGGHNSVEIRDAGLTSAIWITGSVNGDLMFGTSFADIFRGGAGDDTLLGGDGNDTLDGGAGDDLLNGGTGKDKLSGGVGNDIFRFDSPIADGTNIDLVADFTSGSDTLQLDSSNYFQGLALGQLSAAQFSSGPATGAGPQIVYDQSAGALYYDSNGAGDGGASRFATLTNKPVLTASDFAIV